MEIKKNGQYNISFSKFKMLSSTSGVGSVITTKWGGYIMPLCIDEWGFIKALSDAIRRHPDSEQSWPDDVGVEIVSDERFISYLKQKKNFGGLRCLAAIPHVQLTGANYIDYKNHPLFIKHKQQTNDDLGIEKFYIPGINFPKWFVSKNFELKRIDEWLRIWREKECNDGREEYFAPPRDPNAPTKGKYRDSDSDPNPPIDKTIYQTLTPVTLVLICANGHISDIPWERYFCARLDGVKVDEDCGFDLFNYPFNNCSNGGRHNLQWVKNRNQAESWGTLKCKHCQKSVSLAGIMNLKVLCPGEKPWQPDNNQPLLPSHERCMTGPERTVMQVAMVTSNSIYYAFTQNSLYVPIAWIPNSDLLSGDADEALKDLNNTYKRIQRKTPEMTEQDFLNTETYNNLLKWATEHSFDITEREATIIKNKFLGIPDDVADVVKAYRQEEFNVFVTNNTTPEVDSKLEFNDVDLKQFGDTNLPSKFLKIKQVSRLAITSTQLGFSRVKMPMPRFDDTGHVVYDEKQIRPIYSGNINDVTVLPANQIYGEGLFFAFDSDKVNEWANNEKLNRHCQIRLENGSMGEFLKSEMDKYGKAKFYLLHTFSHIIMKELEFSCGYPTASLSERLYYSDGMCGVLIYTADGAEGSMGGLVWQGQPALIERIILSAIRRASECSADPLCWENSDGLNKAACFSCAMVSETSCEQQNLGLDRRALVDPEFGFFKEFV